jgi:MFS family permease
MSGSAPRTNSQARRQRPSGEAVGYLGTSSHSTPCHFIFAIGSIVCAAATTMGMMLTGRSIQGAAPGGIVILVNICISDLFTERSVLPRQYFRD